MKKVTKIITLLNQFSDARDIIKNSLKLYQKLDIVWEILFVCEMPLFDIPSFFNSHDNSIDKDKIKDEISHILKKLNINESIAIFVYIDDSLDRVKRLIYSDKDMIITGYKSGIYKDILKDIKNPLLVVKNSKISKKSITILDLNSDFKECLNKTHFLFSDIENFLLYDYKFIIDPSMPSQLQNSKEFENLNRKRFKEILNFSSLDGDFFIDDSIDNKKVVDYLSTKHSNLIIDCTGSKNTYLVENLNSNVLYI